MSRGTETIIFFDRLTNSRIDIEHLFGATANMWKRIHTKHTWKLLSLNKRVREHLFSIFFMTNVYSCFRGNKSSVKYNLVTPDVEVYLDVDEDDWYDGDDADEWMLHHLNNQIR